MINWCGLQLEHKLAKQQAEKIKLQKFFDDLLML